MSIKYEVPESVVIVTGESGVTATLRFKTSSRDRILSSPNKDSIYWAIEKYVMGEVQSVRKKEN